MRESPSTAIEDIIEADHQEGRPGRCGELVQQLEVVPEADRTQPGSEGACSILAGKTMGGFGKEGRLAAEA